MKVLKRKEVYIPLMILGVFAFLFLCQSKVNIKKNMYIEEYNNALNDYVSSMTEQPDNKILKVIDAFKRNYCS